MSLAAAAVAAAPAAAPAAAAPREGKRDETSTAGVASPEVLSEENEPLGALSPAPSQQHRWGRLSGGAVSAEERAPRSGGRCRYGGRIGGVFVGKEQFS